MSGPLLHLGSNHAMTAFCNCCRVCMCVCAGRRGATLQTIGIRCHQAASCIKAFKGGVHKRSSCMPVVSRLPTCSSLLCSSLDAVPPGPAGAQTPPQPGPAAHRCEQLQHQRPRHASDQAPVHSTQCCGHISRTAQHRAAGTSRRLQVGILIPASRIMSPQHAMQSSTMISRPSVCPSCSGASASLCTVKCTAACSTASVLTVSGRTTHLHLLDNDIWAQQ